MKKLLIFTVIYLSLAALLGSSVIKNNNKAVAQEEKRLFYDAEKLIDKALKKDEDNPILNYNRGVIKLRQYEEYKDKSGLEEAVESLEKAKADSSRTNLYSAYYNQANGYYHLKDYPAAIGNYQASNTFLDSTSVDPDLLYNYANSLYKLADSEAKYDSLFTNAQQIYQGTVGMVDREHKQHIMHNLGNSFFKQEMYQDAIGCYIEALKLNPESEDTRKNYEIALREIEKQQSQEQQQDGEGEDEDKDEEQQESPQTSQQEQEQQQQDAQDKQEQYQDLNKEERDKLDAEKKLDALLQQQSQSDNEKKPDVMKPRPTGRYW